ncbi:MAG: hypothetical protein Q4P28_03905 [Tissierellia bacterium]|nr:hypothetical protein [Tissierellia bacterium]
MNKENAIVINPDGTYGYCTVTLDSFSKMITKSQKLILNSRIDTIKQSSIKCKNCQEFPICYGSTCAIRAKRENNNICTPIKGNEDIFVDIINEQDLIFANID